MDLYNVKQQFTLGAYKTVAGIALPDDADPEYPHLLLYKARALIALGRTNNASSLLPSEPDLLSLKAVKSLTRYIIATEGKEEDDEEEENEEADAALEELRDLSVEIEGDEDNEVKGDDKWYVRIIAATAFARAGEVEEALETLAVKTNKESLEAVHLTAQLYLSISRPDLARQVVQRASSWCDDDLALQAIEATLSLSTGADAYSDASGFYTEQLGNPALTSSHLLVARGLARLMKGEVSEARSDLEEVLKGGSGQEDNEEALAVSVVAAGLPGGSTNRGEADELFSQLSGKYPLNPLVRDIHEKSEAFDEFASKYTIPARA